jgi:hypothetical protein
LDELLTASATYACQLAQLDAWRGEPDQAFEWLEKARSVWDAELR